MKRVKFFLILLPAVFSLLCWPKGVLAETQSFSTTKDTYANEAYPDKVNGNFGSVTLSNKYTNRLGYLRFEDLNLPEGAVVDQAILKFYAHEVHYADKAKLNLGPVTSSWEEAALTWNSKPTIDQSQAVEAEIDLTTGWKEIPVTNLVRLWWEENLDNYGLFIYPFGFLYATPETEFALSFKSKESGDQAAKLEVEYHLQPSPTPEPSATPEPTSVEATPTQKASQLTTEAPETSREPDEEEISPAPTETSPSIEATQEGEKKGLLANISAKEVVIGGTCLLLAAAGGGAFALAFLKKQAKKKKKKFSKRKGNITDLS